MTKYFILILSLFVFAGCDAFYTPVQSTIEVEQVVDEEYVPTTNDEYIDSIADDTVINTSVARVPHTKSSIPMLGILISYENVQITSTSATWSNKLFGTSEHQLNHYFKEVSNSNFQITKAIESDGTANDGIVSVRLNYNHPNTDIDSYLFESATYPDLYEALVALNDKIDFSIYDEDGNGKITPDELLLTFIIAGYEDSYEGWHVQNGIWAHQYCMSDSNTPTLDGVTLMGCRDDGNFALFGERHDVRSSHDATIGIIAHELGHSAFSLPDLYNTGSAYGGIGYFGLMGAGAWGVQDGREYPGNTPTHLSAWSKIYNGWITPRTAEVGSTSLQTTSSDSYDIIKIPISANQYYLLENRDNSGYDKGLYVLDGAFDGGMAIWHINENKLTTSYFEANSVNADTSDKGVDLVEAANATIDYGGAGDEKALFYYLNVDAFGTKITDISSRGSSMTLNIN